MINKSLFLKIGLGGIVNGVMITFDFQSKNNEDKLRPYLCKILGRDFKYGFKREFVDKIYSSYTINPYGGTPLSAINFELEPFIVYEYKRFPSMTLGEIEEGYFVVLSDRIIEIEQDEIIHWCGTAKEKEKRKDTMKVHFSNKNKKFAREDIDF